MSGTKHPAPSDPSEQSDEIQMAPVASKPAANLETPVPNKSRRWVFILPVAIGLLLFFILNRNAKELEPIEAGEVAHVLRVIEATRMDVAPRAIGYGTSMPGQIWQAVAEVRGRVTEIHPDLASGAFIKKDTVLVKIDERDYELALAANRATIEQIKAQQSELSVQETNTRALLKIEECSLKLAEEALKRKRSLLEEGIVAPDEVDTEERTVLTQRQTVQSLKNTLALIPSQQQSLEANLKSSQAQLAQTQRDLERVIIKAPFDCRLGKVTLEEAQFIAAGQVLFEAYSVMVTEVEARFPPEQLRPILSGIDLAKISSPETSAMDRLRETINVSARVRISGFPDLEPWPARFDRVRESVDPQTRTIGIVVAVDEPYKKAIPGRRPPLTKDLFCEVELQATKKIITIVIPRSALRGRAIYMLSKEGRLQKREVTPGFDQGTFVTIKSGIEPGEIVVVSDPVPAIEGMLVDPIVDDVLMSQLRIEASGDGDLK
jgi:multidrug efflux pump subunit AcrA (membrane-fusion protein)